MDQVAEKPRLKVTPCCLVGCGLPKWREVDPVMSPGLYHRVHLKGWCECIDEADEAVVRNHRVRSRPDMQTLTAAKLMKLEVHAKKRGALSTCSIDRKDLLALVEEIRAYRLSGAKIDTVAARLASGEP